MHLIVKKILSLPGKIISPRSKSQSLCGIMFSLLAQGKSTLLNVLHSDATPAAMEPKFTMSRKREKATPSIGVNVNFDNPLSNNPIILIGFMHVGKTLIGRRLAKSLNKQFIDLDREIEKLYEENYPEPFPCRQIQQSHDESHYRQLESEVLQQVIKLKSCVISLGGSTSLSQSNQEIIKPHRLLHVIAPRGIVFERIMVEGRPAFFDPNKDPYESFSRLWDEHHKIYRKLTTYTVDNSSTIEQAVNEAKTHLSNQQNYSSHA